VLPPIEDYIAQLERIWERGQVTNHGSVAADLETQLRHFLGVRHFALVANGTLALQIAIRALDLSGDVITTPFSYVATTSSIVWERLRPVFVDIEPHTFTIDVEQIEDAITEQTSAILATHVYGFPCDVDRIAEIAARHGLKVVYDAAHAFGVLRGGVPVCASGDVSALSFHATKVFHTIEGGGLTSWDDDVAHRIEYMRNHGHRGTDEYWGLGINGKCSEVHAAVGLCLLPLVPDLISARRERVERYRERLATTGIVTWDVPPEVDWNYGYFPVVFESEQSLMAATAALSAVGVHPRRYFHPALTDLPYVAAAPLPVASSISERVLCLPLHDSLPLEEVDRIAATLEQSLGTP
jgi:dTDP-4-amino-4,6-dideoxygalactose transaminase